MPSTALESLLVLHLNDNTYPPVLISRCLCPIARSAAADFQLSTQCYFDAEKMMYYSGGVWSYEKDPGKR